jgi:tetratricopeptide (TPR) repeat protein
MAKQQRRARSRPAPPKAKNSSIRPRSLQPSAPLSLPQPPPEPAVPASPPLLRTTYVEAVALYERGLQALQGHDYAGARDVFRAVLSRYPEEKELHERVRLYLNICERQVAPRQSPAPRSVEERLYAATLALNAGEYDQALSHIQSVIGDDSDNDHAHYMRAVALTVRGDVSDALPSLVRAIELNHENRALARQDPDLEPLRRDEGFRQALDAASAASRQDKKRPSRGRFTRS